MERFETLLQSCIDYVTPNFRLVENEAGNVLEKPLEESSFPAQLVQLKWPAIKLDEIASTDLDAFVLLVAKRVIADALTMENDKTEAAIKSGIRIAAVVLDFCFHSRKYRQSPVIWSNAYFALFSSVVDSLTWPRGLVQFWPYAESRIEWFKMCNSLDPVPAGASNLVSYKQPLYDKLRHWNELLKTVQNNSYLNTPMHYEMKFRVEKFLSELLPISEESNFNRSAMFATKVTSGNPWNKTISSGTRKDLCSENIFATDFNHVYDSLILSPLEFIYKPLDFKNDVDKTLGSLLDAILELEEEFYRLIKVSHETVSSINGKLNNDFPSDFELTKSRVPNYIKISQKNEEERRKYWENFIAGEMSLSSVLLPTPFDTSVSNPVNLYDQMMEVENDYFRKQFILQICFTMSLIKQIVMSSEVEKYYKSCYQKERPSRSINFDSLDDSNRKKTVSLCGHILNNRVSKFYRQRDPEFTSIIQKTLKADDMFLKSKIDGFRGFNSFNIPHEIEGTQEVDYSFKKFGFVLLGSKSISNVWKIKTGLDEMQKCPHSAKDLYEDLRSKSCSSEADHDASKDESADRIVKDWQILRRLRPQYLFYLSRVDEDTGINGLFSTSRDEANATKKRQFIDSMMERLREPHQRKLEAARRLKEDRLNRKRELHEAAEHGTIKQRRLNEDEATTSSPSRENETEEDKSDRGAASIEPEQVDNEAPEDGKSDKSDSAGQ